MLDGHFVVVVVGSAVANVVIVVTVVAGWLTAPTYYNARIDQHAYCFVTNFIASLILLHLEIKFVAFCVGFLHANSLTSIARYLQ